ncbi:hypothetical protein FBUS_08326 [Fasciolopsis buskii]|uniref:Uncharacterized protein n=1 Tax=Fasciolopsis buskii TaxID=27845 RepID=A0A8E0VFE5_9TREM|nr:hypothetical protein FBUS_08326 [Fasciolopsis buski]
MIPTNAPGLVQWTSYLNNNANTPLVVNQMLLGEESNQDTFVQDPVRLLNLAVSSNKVQVVKFLLRAGMPVLPDEVTGSNFNGRHPLHATCSRRNLTLAKILLTLSDTDPDVPDKVSYASRIKNFILMIHAKLGYTVLFKAAGSGYDELIHLLLKHGADPNRVDELRHRSALHESSRRGFSRSVKLLCEGGANPNSWDKVKFLVFACFLHFPV